ncbi:hypothetical protein GDO81_020289 [Engystomops pustulosus]|uniref:Uncharacterized protein n=1 Tax=Engystomops pustulosus TaxID=76066 RepID=A0AAV6ZKR8_ENGPU|nr:hypothetical protein GDO81_020289 [Engystomops pustulosus]
MNVTTNSHINIRRHIASRRYIFQRKVIVMTICYYYGNSSWFGYISSTCFAVNLPSLTGFYGLTKPYSTKSVMLNHLYYMRHGIV